MKASSKRRAEKEALWIFLDFFGSFYKIWSLRKTNFGIFLQISIKERSFLQISNTASDLCSLSVASWMSSTVVDFFIYSLPLLSFFCFVLFLFKSQWAYKPSAPPDKQGPSVFRSSIFSEYWHREKIQVRALQIASNDPTTNLLNKNELFKENLFYINRYHSPVRIMLSN